MEFLLKKHVHMYNHLMSCTDGGKTYEALCEDAPAKQRTLVFWMADFKLPKHREMEFVDELQAWCKSQGFACIIHQGEGR